MIPWWGGALLLFAGVFVGIMIVALMSAGGDDR